MWFVRLAMAGLLLVGWSATPAAPIVQDEPSAVCVNENTVRFTPDVGPTSERSSYLGEDGSITCVGEINSREVTGIEGQVRDSGVLEGSCAAGNIRGTLSITIPTSGEATSLTMVYEGSYVPGVGTTTSPQGFETFEYRVTEGDCVTTPITEIELVGQVVVED